MARRPAAYSATPVARNPQTAPSSADVSRLTAEALARASADSTAALEAKTQGDTEHRADAGEGQSTQCMHPEQVTPVGAADPQDRLFATQRAGQHPPAYEVRIAAAKHREARGRRTCAWPSGVVARHLERIGDVVDQDVLPGCDGIDGVSDRFVWAKAVSGSASSGSRSTKTSTSTIG